MVRLDHPMQVVVDAEPLDAALEREGVRSLESFDATELARHVATVALDEKDPGPGYTSFGGPGFDNPGTLGGWAPGARPIMLPDGIAYELAANSRVVLQVHYGFRLSGGAGAVQPEGHVVFARGRGRDFGAGRDLVGAQQARGAPISLEPCGGGAVQRIASHAISEPAVPLASVDLTDALEPAMLTVPSVTQPSLKSGWLRRTSFWPPL